MKKRIETAEHRCIGCGSCRESLPEIFYLDGYMARVLPEADDLLEGNDILLQRVKELMAECPAEAIDFIKEGRESGTDH